MAAVTAPERTAAQHQSLLHFVGEGRWSDEKVLAKVREMDSHDAKAILANLQESGSIATHCNCAMICI
jgi:SRSO17 transposase